MTPDQEIKNLLPKLPHKLQVCFALYCAKDVSSLVKDEHKEIVKACIDTVELWLRGKATAEECRAIATAADVYATNAIITHQTAWSASIKSAVHTAYSAWSTTSIIYHSNNSALTAAMAASCFSNFAHPFDETRDKYISHLKTMIDELTPIEKVLFRCD
jgi:hypothetical protein